MNHDHRILVVDDDADIREALGVALSDEGYTVAQAGDGGAALAWLRDNPLPAAILLDWNMAPMNGAELLTELDADPTLATIPVVVLTADTRPSARPERRAGRRWLTKPFQLDALFETLRETVR